MNKISHNTFIHQGSIPGELLVYNENTWYVTRQTWSGSIIVSTDILDMFYTEQEAQRYLDKIKHRKMSK